jgi:hypothetical protein
MGDFSRKSFESLLKKSFRAVFKPGSEAICVLDRSDAATVVAVHWLSNLNLPVPIRKGSPNSGDQVIDPICRELFLVQKFKEVFGGVTYPGTTCPMVELSCVDLERYATILGLEFTPVVIDTKLISILEEKGAAHTVARAFKVLDGS